MIAGVQDGLRISGLVGGGVSDGMISGFYDELMMVESGVGMWQWFLHY